MFQDYDCDQALETRIW